VSADEVVVDASLALKWVERERYSDEASELLESWQEQRRRLTAPALFAYEATNAREPPTCDLAASGRIRALATWHPQSSRRHNPASYKGSL
jgi:hypothetical protein